MCPYSGLWGGFLDCDSQFTILSPPSFDGPQPLGFDALPACVPVSISSYVHIVPNVLPRSLCSWPWTSLHLLEEGHNHPIVRFAYLCHMIGEELVFFSFLYIKLFELGVEVALNNRSAVTHHKVNLLKFPLRSSSFERTDDAFVLFICFCVFHL